MKKTISKTFFGQLKPRYIGPIGNRISSVAGIPGNHLVYYAGSAAGGIFKTSDGGVNWSYIFDDQARALPNENKPERASSVSALAVSQSNPNVVWAGTGEFWIRTPISIGNGVYKSVDAGATWTRMSNLTHLHESGRISKVLIHPTNPDIVWVGVVGNCYEPQKVRGIHKTTDGGLTWRQTLHVDKNTGCSDICIDPNNPEILFAGMWEFKMHSYIRISGGAGSGLYKSIDGGETWVESQNGLPTEKYPVGKISVGVSKSDSNYVYANIETGDGEPTWDFSNVGNGQLWSSKDGGTTWDVVNYQRSINSRAAYYTRLEVSPDNRYEVYFFGNNFSKTVDGGLSIDLNLNNQPGGDHHEGWIDPTNGDRMAVAHDLGISITQNRGETWTRINLPNAQMYSVNVDEQIPYNVYGNCQDRGGTWGPSNARIPVNSIQDPGQNGNIQRSNWRFAGGSENGSTFADPTDYNLIWSSGASYGPQGGVIALMHRQTGHSREVSVNFDFVMGYAPKDVDLRFHWFFPIAASPHARSRQKGAPRRIYTGSQFVHSTDNRGQSWERISPELTGRDDRYLQSSGGLTADNLANRMAYCISFIAESYFEPGVIWVGTNDQRLWRSHPGRGRKQELHWHEWTDRIKELPPPFRKEKQRKHPVPQWGKVTCIQPSRHDKDTVYITYDFHQAGNPKPYILKTTNGGKTWEHICNGIPHSVFSYVHYIAEDVKNPNLLFAGTENALYVSFNYGDHWQEMPGLPPAPVSGMVVQSHYGDLVLSTFGRGFYIYDDLSPLRQISEVGNKTIHLFEMGYPIYRFQFIADFHHAPPGQDPTVGDDPPSPAPISFYLKSPSKVKVTISHHRGKVARTHLIEAEDTVAGINRFWWDLQSDSTETIKLRTNPPNQKGTKYCKNGIRPYSTPVIGNSLSLLMPPGKYDVQVETLKADGTVHKCSKIKTIIVLKDPTARPELSKEEALREIHEQYELNKKVYDLLNTVAVDINQIEYIRVQLEQLAPRVQQRRPLRLIYQLNEQLLDIEQELFQMSITGFGEDLARFPAKLVEKLVYLGGWIATGDFRPTDPMKETTRKHEKAVRELNKQLQKIVKETIPRFNEKMHKYGVPGILTDTPEHEELCSLFTSGTSF